MNEMDNGRNVSEGEKQEGGAEAPRFFVGLGASAGGLEAIESFFGGMPKGQGLAFIVVQHLSPDHKSLMVELLSKKTEMEVKRAEHGMRVEPEKVYLITPKHDLKLFHGKLVLEEYDPEEKLHLPIDVFFRSLAEDVSDKAVGIVLSGTGSDGARGVRAIKEAGGMVMIQDRGSARFDGMPRAAASTGVADFILPPEEMPRRLMALTRPIRSKVSQEADSNLRNREDSLTRLFNALRERTKVDFTYYKHSTILRRIERRMMLNGIDGFDEYVDFVLRYPGEITALYKELLIGVTRFFRDGPSHQVLRERWLPTVLNPDPPRELRFWVAGCSSGEEAYTLAILTRECMEEAGVRNDVKIFATDIDKQALSRAAEGLYPEGIAADVDNDLLNKYFYKRKEGYKISRNIREMVVFARHDLIRDPPFTRIDFVSCRNLLIYLQPVLQRKALDMFHFSLRPGGVLFLGSSETVGDYADRLEPVDTSHKIYRAKGRVQKLPLDKNTYDTSLMRRYGDFENRSLRLGGERRGWGGAHTGEERYFSRLLEVLSHRYIPITVVVNERLDIIYTLGDTEGLFKLPSGKPVFDISKMVVRELAIPMTTGIGRAFRERESIVFKRIQISLKGQPVKLDMRVTPLPERKGQESLVAVFLEKDEKTSGEEISEQDVDASVDVSEQAAQRIEDLETELQFTKENLQATIEELETANEELQATNEELLASNEELQSTNEELQSANEELHTVNVEHQNKILELTELNNDVENLLTDSMIGKVMLDENLEIRRFSLRVKEVFHIMEGDMGRPLSQISHRFIDFDPVAAARQVQKEGEPYLREVQSDDDRWFLARFIPYSIGPDVFSGVVLAFIDITDLKSTQRELLQSKQTAEDIVRHMPAGLFTYRVERGSESGEKVLVLEDSNREAERLTGVSARKFGGKPFQEIWQGSRGAEVERRLLDTAKTGETYVAEEVFYEDEHLMGIYRIRAFPLPNERLAVSFEDIRQQKEAERKLRESQEAYERLFRTMSQGVVYQSADGTITDANPAAEQMLGLTLDQMRGRTSMDPRWHATDDRGDELPGHRHPAMVALKTGEPVEDFLMSVYNPENDRKRWLLVNAQPEFYEGESRPFRVYATLSDVTGRVEQGDLKTKEDE